MSEEHNKANTNLNNTELSEPMQPNADHANSPPPKKDIIINDDIDNNDNEINNNIINDDEMEENYINDLSKNILIEYGMNRKDGISSIPNKKRFMSKGVGAVVYMEPKNYTENSDMELIHLDAGKTEIYETICETFFKEKRNILKYAVIGHEHGSKLKKCHYQCGFVFNDKIMISLSPGKFKIRDITYLIMFQTATNPNALITYCKKEHDFQFIGDGNGLKKKEKGKECTNIYSKILANGEMTRQEIIDLVNREGDEEDKKNFLFSGDRLINNYLNFIKMSEKPPFEWIFPPHMRDQEQDVEKVAVFNLIYKWFTNECIVENVPRRKALVLFSMRRGCGKTEFAKRLVPHPDYYIYCRGSINGKQFEQKREARLLILDDLHHSNASHIEEMMKALVSGESTDITSKYCQYFFENHLPTIICTNNSKVYENFRLNPMYRTQCYVIGFNFYLGPPGTEPEKLTKVDSFETEEISDLLGRKREEASK